MQHDSLQFDSPLPIVHAWQEAVNQNNVDRLLALSDPDIEIVGPRGSSQGHQALQNWLAWAGLSLRTLRAFVRDETVILAQHGTWKSADTNADMGERDIATRFHVHDGRVMQIERYDTLEAALQAVGFDAKDEMAEW